MSTLIKTARRSEKCCPLHLPETGLMKNTPKGVMDIFLQPGEWYFGDRQVRIRTLLGSCVAMVFWHPKLLMGGMCHFMLPTAGRKHHQPLSARYADEAMLLLLRDMKKTGVPHTEYQAKLFGGGDMFAALTQQSGVQIGQQNIEAARRLVEDYGFNCVAEHLGGDGHRNVIFDICSGNVWIRQHNLQVFPERGKTKVGICTSMKADAGPPSLQKCHGISPPSRVCAISIQEAAEEVRK